jgi:hypothetical protein
MIKQIKLIVSFKNLKIIQKIVKKDETLFTDFLSLRIRSNYDLFTFLNFKSTPVQNKGQTMI